MESRPNAGRRRLLAAGMAAAVAAPYLALRSHPVFATGAARYSTRAIDLVRESLVVDMLAPLTLSMIWEEDVFAKPLAAEMRAEFVASGITGFHHSIGFGGPDARTMVLEYLAGWSAFVDHNADLFTLVGVAGDLDRAKKTGRIAVIMGIQNADHFRDKKDVAHFYHLGLRCSQLTYNSQNLLGSGATERVDGGLTDFGAEIVAEMNQVGMLVDVSHCGPRTTLDAIEASKTPIAITHSNCRALNDHPRLKTDEAIRKLAAKGGVMGITGVRMFVRGSEPTTIEHLVDHVDHVAKLVGVEHVGIGSDTDLRGYDAMPDAAKKALHGAYKGSYGFRDRDDIEGYDHPKKAFDLTEALIRRGYSNEAIRGILGGNFRRLLGGIWV
jgi:membrane dipeptidase